MFSIRSVVVDIQLQLTHHIEVSHHMIRCILFDLNRLHRYPFHLIESHNKFVQNQQMLHRYKILFIMKQYYQKFQNCLTRHSQSLPNLRHKFEPSNFLHLKKYFLSTIIGTIYYPIRRYLMKISVVDLHTMKMYYPLKQYHWNLAR